jgi:nucleotide-binding universal stress UspA family protein
MRCRAVADRLYGGNLQIPGGGSPIFMTVTGSRGEEGTMMRNILVPLDGSDFGEQALPRAVELAQRHDAKLHLVHVHSLPVLPMSMDGMGVFDPDWPQRQRDEESAYVERLANTRVRSAVPAVVVRLLDEPIGEALASYIRDEAIDFVVMTTHGRGGLSRAWLGSVADELVRSTDVPLLLMRPTDEGVPEIAAAPHVLLPLDGSPLSEAAIEPAVRLAGPEGRITLLHILPPMYVAGAPYGAGVVSFDAAAHEIEKVRGTRYLREVAERLQQRVANVGTEIATHAQPARAIAQAISATGADVVAIATHGRGGVARWALGSVADKVIRSGDVPVLVVRPRVAAGERRAAGTIQAMPIP